MQVDEMASLLHVSHAGLTRRVVTMACLSVTVANREVSKKDAFIILRL
jgi:hypothetical protein